MIWLVIAHFAVGFIIGSVAAALYYNSSGDDEHYELTSLIILGFMLVWPFGLVIIIFGTLCWALGKWVKFIATLLRMGLWWLTKIKDNIKKEGE